MKSKFLLILSILLLSSSLVIADPEPTTTTTAAETTTTAAETTTTAAETTTTAAATTTTAAETTTTAAETTTTAAETTTTAAETTTTAAETTTTAAESPTTTTTVVESTTTTTFVMQPATTTTFVMQPSTTTTLVMQPTTTTTIPTMPTSPPLATSDSSWLPMYYSGVNKAFVLTCDPSDKNNVYAAGLAANYIYFWDNANSKWTYLSNDQINGDIYCLAFTPDGKKLIAGGNFTKIGNDPYKYLAAFNIGKQGWEKVSPSPIYAPVKSIAFDNSGNLYVAANSIYMLMNNSWKIRKMGVFNTLYFNPDTSTLYAGGNNILSKCFGPAFLSSPWVPVGNPPGNINSIKVVSNLVVIGGNFSGNNGVLFFNGTNWARLANGLMPPVFALAYDKENNILYAGGGFTTTADNKKRKYIAQINVNQPLLNGWQQLGSGAANKVYSLAVSTNKCLYVGGEFTSVGNNSASKYVAKWDGSIIGSTTTTATTTTTAGGIQPKPHK